MAGRDSSGEVRGWGVLGFRIGRGGRRSRRCLASFAHQIVTPSRTSNNRQSGDADNYPVAHALSVTSIGNSPLRFGLPSYNTNSSTVARQSPPDTTHELRGYQNARLASSPSAASMTETALRRRGTSIEEEFLNAISRYRRRGFYRLEHRRRTRATRPQRGCARRPLVRQRG